MTVRIAALVLVLSACTYTVGGDSTMHQIAEEIGQTTEHTQPGCGWTGNGFPQPCEIPLGSADGRVILGVSVWDVGVSDLSGYINAQEHYGEVIWAAIPEQDTGVSIWTAGTITAHNARVSTLLGCPLASPEIRTAETYDGIHYTSTGAQRVAARFEVLTGPTCEGN